MCVCVCVSVCVCVCLHYLWKNIELPHLGFFYLAVNKQ